MRFIESFAEFAARIGTVQSIEQILDAVQALISHFGFDTIIFSGVPGDSDTLSKMIFAARTPHQLFETYLGRRYATINPVLRHLRNCRAPFRWRDAYYDEAHEPEAAAYMASMRTLRLDGSVVVPITAADGTRCAAWMTGTGGGVETIDQLTQLQLIASIAFARLYRMAGPLPESGPKLTRREREVMTWTALGKSAWEIGVILGITPRTVRDHIETARRKLSATNRTHAIAIAVRDGLIVL